MKEYKKVRRYVNELFKTCCNKCGKNLYEDGIGVFNTHDFVVSNGFGDKHDGEHHFFDLCDGCYCKLIKSFIINILIKTEY